MSGKVTPRPKRQKPKHFIREWRKFRGLTQERLAERVGLTPGAISQLETGMIGYTQPTLEALAYALMCEPGDLLSRNPNMDGAVVDLLRMIRGKDQKMVLDIIKALPDRTGTNG